MRLDIGCGPNKRSGFTGIDRVASPGVDIVHNLTVFPWPIERDSAEEIVLFDVLEHLPDTVGTMNEIWRISRSGCRVEILYPYWRSFGAYSDPTHVRFFNEYMIDYFLRPGTTRRNENRYAYYTDKYWKLISRELITYPGLRWIPAKTLSFISRHSVDVIHGIRLVITPDK